MTPSDEEELATRRRADEALKATDERFRTVFEEGGFGIALVGVDLRVLQANGVLCQMLGYTEPELMRMTLAQVIAPDDEPDDELARLVFAGDTSVYRQEKRFVHKTGQLVHVALTVSAVRSPDGAPRYGIAMVEDITQRRRVELELRQAQKLEGIGMLAGGIAHNFNNVLTAISGYTELLMREPGLPDRAQAYAQKVLEVTHRSGDLTAQLLAFSRRQVTEGHLFDLSAAVRSAESALAPLVGEAVTLQTRLHPTPCRVSGACATHCW